MLSKNKRLVVVREPRLVPVGGTVHKSAVPCGFAFPSGTGSCQGAVGSQYPPDRSLLRQMTRNGRGPGFQLEVSIKQGSRYMSLGFKFKLWPPVESVSRLSQTRHGIYY